MSDNGFRVGTVRKVEDAERGIRPHFYVRLVEPAAEPWHIAWCVGDQQLSGWQSDDDIQAWDTEVVGFVPVVECGAQHAHPDEDGMRRGIAGLEVKGAVIADRPVVVGQWGGTGLGFSTTAMRACAEIILAACADAEAMVSRETELST